MSAVWQIAMARTADDLTAVRGLFEAYAASLEVDLAYQDFARELQELPGAYAPPLGTLLLARNRDGAPGGCVALRPLGGPSRAEMKRLYVAPNGRGAGLGKRLALAAIDAAAQIGYREIVLDTLPSMAAAQALYRALGFAVIEPYYPTPIEGTIFMRLILNRSEGSEAS